jgi:hypothetical protein
MQYYKVPRPPSHHALIEHFPVHTLPMQPTTPAYPLINAIDAINKGNIHRAPPNGVLSCRSATRSSTLLRYLLRSCFFSSVDLVISLSLSARFLPPPDSVRLNAPASLLGLRCNIAGTDVVLFADGMDGVSGIK